MFGKAVFKALFCILVACLMSGSLLAYGYSGGTHRLVIVLDASGSMDRDYTGDGGNLIKATDPDGLRFQAIEQFFAQPQEEGYSVGWVVFSTDIDAQAGLVPIQSQADKERLVQEMKVASERAERQHTNIGKALDRAVDILVSSAPSSGENDSAILFLSDGMTDLAAGSDDVEQQAIEKARRNHIPVFSMCLNVSGEANPAELRNISAKSGEGGEFREITSMEGLNEVLLSDYYEKITGKSVVNIKDELVFDENGEAMESFQVPGFGVRGVSVRIEGRVDRLWLTNGNDSYDQTPPIGREWAVANLPDNPTPGEWVLHAHGEVHGRIKVKLIYDAQLQVDIDVLSGNDLHPGDSTEILVTFSDDDGSHVERAEKRYQYTGFHAFLTVQNAVGEKQDVPQSSTSPEDRGFVFPYTFPIEGNYSFSGTAVISIDDSEDAPRFTSDIHTVSITTIPNTAPVPEPGNPRTVWSWPWRTSYQVNLQNLAKDRETPESRLKYTALGLSSDASFEPDSRLLSFSLTQSGERIFRFQVSDDNSETPLSCEVDVTVQVKNGTSIILIMILVAVAIIALVFLYRFLNPPYFHGEILASTMIDGNLTQGAPMNPPAKSRKYPLSMCGLENIDPERRLDYTRCFFLPKNLPKNAGRAERRYIILKTNRKVTTRKGITKEIRLSDNAKVYLWMNDERNRQLILEYHEKENGGPHGNWPHGTGRMRRFSGRR